MFGKRELFLLCPLYGDFFLYFQNYFAFTRATVDFFLHSFYTNAVVDTSYTSAVLLGTTTLFGMLRMAFNWRILQIIYIKGVPNYVSNDNGYRCFLTSKINTFEIITVDTVVKCSSVVNKTLGVRRNHVAVVLIKRTN